MSTKAILGVAISLPAEISTVEKEYIYKSYISRIVTMLYHNQKLLFALYLSGPTISWLASSHKEVLDLIGELVKRKQVEILGGAFYEPLFTYISRTSQKEQIESLLQYNRKIFHCQVSGGFFIPGTFDRSAVSVFHSTNLKYIIVDERYLCHAKDTDDYYIAESQGKVIKVLTRNIDISQIMEDSLPLNISCENILYTPNGLSLCLPQLIDIVNPDRYFQFLQNISERIGEQSNLELMLPRTAVCSKRFGVTDIVSSPRGSNSVYDAFYTRPESRLLYGRCMHASLYVSKEKDKSRKRVAYNHLYQGQNHRGFLLSPDAMGIQSLPLRTELYKNLLQAYVHVNSRGPMRMQEGDFDFDGKEELLFSSQILNVLVDVKYASIMLLESVKTKHNYLNTFLLHPTPSIPAWAFIDYFAEKARVSELSHVYKRTWKSKVLQYAMRSSRKNGRIQVEFLGKEEESSLEVVKTCIFRRSSIIIHYDIINHHDVAVQRSHYCEVNMTFPRVEEVKVHIDKDKHCKSIMQTIQYDAKSCVFSTKDEQHIHIESNDSFLFFCTPVRGMLHETAPHPFSHVDDYQHHHMMLVKHMKIPEHTTYSFSYVVKITP